MAFPSPEPHGHLLPAVEHHDAPVQPHLQGELFLQETEVRVMCMMVPHCMHPLCTKMRHEAKEGTSALLQGRLSACFMDALLSCTCTCLSPLSHLQVVAGRSCSILCLSTCMDDRSEPV